MSDHPSRLDEITEALFARAPESAIEPSLDRTAFLLDLMGNPQRSAPVVHITGTNGKSSTARMIDALIRSVGLRSGLYTSPHLESVTERIQVDGEPLPAERFVELYDDLLPLVALADRDAEGRGEPPLTFFEVITALAFAAFADAPVDVMVLEVGLGGRWDATNTADAAVAVVTPIAVDHTEYLGPQVPQIAEEKAGIIKPGSVAVLAHQTAEAAEVLLRACAESGAKAAREGLEFGVVAREVAVGGQAVTLQGLRGRYEQVFLPLFGEYQAANAALALAAVEALVGEAEPLSDEVVRDGLGLVASPGRLEVLRNSPSVIVDAAHNPAGAQALAAALDESFAFSATVGIIGVLQDKDVGGILEALEPALDHVVCTANSSPRALPAARLAAIAEEVFGSHRVTIAEGMVEALEAAVSWADERADQGSIGVVATGSVVTAADARQLVGGPT